jgi:L-threonylcarbamoyladenylate synthase
MSRVVACNPARPDPSVIDDAVSVIHAGGAVVAPTETQYGLMLRADSEQTLSRLQEIKKRPELRKPAVFVRDMAMAETFCTIDSMTRALAGRFLPGPLTLVLAPRPGQTVISESLISPDGIGVRISSSPLVAAIAGRVSCPITATSANISGELTPATVPEIRAALGDGIDLYLDGGPCRSVVPSTVVKIAGGIEILRHGLISEAEIKSFLQTAGVS